MTTPLPIGDVPPPAARSDRPKRPLRQDAARNRARILEAASRLFAESGLEATMDNIAEAAGVGVGTVYRRFPTKQDLIDALVDDRMAQVVELGHHAASCEDPWEGLVRFVDGTLRLQIADRALAELLHSATGVSRQLVKVREELAPRVEELVRRAIEAGELRSDVESSDIALLQVMVGAAADYTRQVSPTAWRRFLNLLLDGLRPCRSGARPLEEPPLTLTQLDAALQAHKGLGRERR